MADAAENRVWKHLLLFAAGHSLEEGLRELPPDALTKSAKEFLLRLGMKPPIPHAHIERMPASSRSLLETFFVTGCDSRGGTGRSKPVVLVCRRLSRQPGPLPRSVPSQGGSGIKEASVPLRISVHNDCQCAVHDAALDRALDSCIGRFALRRGPACHAFLFDGTEQSSASGSTDSPLGTVVGLCIEVNDVRIDDDAVAVCMQQALQIAACHSATNSDATGIAGPAAMTTTHQRNNSALASDAPPAPAPASSDEHVTVPGRQGDDHDFTPRIVTTHPLELGVSGNTTADSCSVSDSVPSTAHAAAVPAAPLDVQLPVVLVPRYFCITSRYPVFSLLHHALRSIVAEWRTCVKTRLLEEVRQLIQAHTTRSGVTNQQCERQHATTGPDCGNNASANTYDDLAGTSNDIVCVPSSQPPPPRSLEQLLSLDQHSPLPPSPTFEEGVGDADGTATTTWRPPVPTRLYGPSSPLQALRLRSLKAMKSGMSHVKALRSPISKQFISTLPWTNRRTTFPDEHEASYRAVEHTDDDAALSSLSTSSAASSVSAQAVPFALSPALDALLEELATATVPIPGRTLTFTHPLLTSTPVVDNSGALRVVAVPGADHHAFEFHRPHATATTRPSIFSGLSELWYHPWVALVNSTGNSSAVFAYYEELQSSLAQECESGEEDCGNACSYRRPYQSSMGGPEWLSPDWRCAAVRWSLPLLLSLVSVDDLITLLTAVVLDYKVVITGGRLSLDAVSSIVLALSLLAAPLLAAGPTIPALPSKWVEALEAPVPMIVGCSQRDLPALWEQDVDTAVCSLDGGTVHAPTSLAAVASALPGRKRITSVLSTLRSQFGSISSSTDSVSASSAAAASCVSSVASRRTSLNAATAVISSIDDAVRSIEAQVEERAPGGCDSVVSEARVEERDTVISEARVEVIQEAAPAAPAAAAAAAPSGTAVETAAETAQNSSGTSGRVKPIYKPSAAQLGLCVEFASTLHTYIRDTCSIVVAVGLSAQHGRFDFDGNAVPLLLPPLEVSAAAVLRACPGDEVPFWEQFLKSQTFNVWYEKAGRRVRGHAIASMP